MQFLVVVVAVNHAPVSRTRGDIADLVYNVYRNSDKQQEQPEQYFVSRCQDLFRIVDLSFVRALQAQEVCS